MRHSTEWAVCAAILFAASIAITVSGLILRAGGGLLIVIFFFMGVGALLASYRFRKLERATPGSNAGSAATKGHRSDRPELRYDRAFNRIAMARREAELLASSGVDVSSANNLIAAAQGALDTHDLDRAYESAQSAHEALVAARRSGPLPSLRSSPHP
ncbi:MAG TPA: hypothetical protein VEG66_08095 [Thermoplasmata archaeon]|nr:hypothetical protein [Thermoplasmata archaeon]